MIRVRLSIGAENATEAASSAVDTAGTYGLVYISSDSIFAAPLKDFDATSYPEQEGENIIPKTVDAPFDYNVKFYVKAEDLDGTGHLLSNANAKIAAFNAALYSQSQGSDVKTLNKVYFFNDYKKVLIVGYPKPIQEATDFWRDSENKAHDIVLVEWTIRVTKPSECNFNLS